MHKMFIKPLHLLIAALLFNGLFVSQSISAQTQTGNTGIWLPAVNLSRSGTASQPLIAVGGKGSSHVMWWDAFDGMRYARLTSTVSGTLSLSATNAVPLVTVYGDRQTYFDNRLRKQITEIRPPRDIRLLSDRADIGHVLWENLSDQLLYAVNPSGAAWSAPVILDQNASAFDATTDVSATLHMAYVRLGGQAGTTAAGASSTGPPGLYYRSRVGGVLSAPIPILPSNYLRAERADDLALGIAANGRGNVVVTWFQPGQNQSYYVVSADFGKTWTSPQPLAGVSNVPASRSSVAVTSNGEFLLIYRENAGRQCSFDQRRSADGGKTWSAPQIVFTEINRCPQRWRFATASDQLWMIGTLNQTVSPLAAKGTTNITTNMLAMWDGNAWSRTTEINLDAFDSSTSQSRQLSCFSVSISDRQLFGVGCDARGDIWSSRLIANLNDLMKAPELNWQRLARLSNTKGPVGSDVVMTHVADGLIGMWSQAEYNGAPSSQVYLSRWNGQEWTQPARVMFDPHSRFEQLSLAAAPDERLHLVWSSDRVYYSQSFVRDSGLAEGWAKPVALSASIKGDRTPSLVVDPRGSALYVAYAVPFNEQRGVYLVTSLDNGLTWQPPQKIFDAAAAHWDAVDAPTIRLDVHTNTLHAVWLKTGLSDSSPRTLFYAKSLDNGKTWSAPQELSSGMIQSPQLVVLAKGQIYIAWHQPRGVYETAVPNEAMGMFSANGGTQWSDPTAINGFGELSSRPALYTDNAGRIYLTGMAENVNGEGRMIYSEWTGQTWSLPESLGVGQRSAERNVSAVEMMPKSGQLVVLARTLVLSDSGNSQFELFSTMRQVQPVNMQPLPTFTPDSTKSNVAVLPTVVSAVVPTPTVMPVISKALQPEARFAPWMTQGLIGGVVFLGLVTLAFGFYRSRQRY